MSRLHVSDTARTTRRGLGLVLLLVALAACRTAPPPPPPPAAVVVAGTDPLLAVASVDLAPDETRDFQLNIPAGIVQSSDVVYLELGSAQNAVLELRGTTYWHVIASSASPERFVSGVLAGVPQPVPAEAQAVQENTACRGPCVIFAPTTTTYYARVVNDTGTNLTAELYLYGYALQDDGEPRNDARSTSPVLAASNAGALELLGDVDFWLAPGHLAATLTVVPGLLDVNAVVVDAAGVVVAGPFVSGESMEVFQGEYVRVRAATGTAAAPAKSSYFIETAPLPGNPTRPPSYLEVAANNSGSAIDQRTAPAGGMVEYRVTIPATVRSRDVVYVELDANLGLELRSASNLTAVASSSSPNGFSAGGSLARAGDGSSAVDALGISASKACRGACVIVKPNSNSYYVRVYGGATSTSFSLFAYGYDLMDDTETANDSTGTAPVLVTTASGAIETFGDVDLWRMASSGMVAFDTVSGGPALRAQLLDAGGVPIPSGLGGGPYASGQSFAVYDGEYVKVSAVNASQAAAAARSSYFLERLGGVMGSAALREPASDR